MNEVPILLKDIAFARSGDKGDSSNIGIITYTEAGYLFLKEKLKEELIFHTFSHLPVRRVKKYLLPNLLAINFILEGALGKGGSLSLKTDAQGKALGVSLLNLPLNIPCHLYPDCIKKNL